MPEDNNAIYSPNNDFLLELAEKQQSVVVYVKNGVQIHGTIRHLFLEYMEVEADRTRPDGTDYIRYDAISTIHVGSYR